MPVPNQRDTVPRRLLRDNAYTALRDAIVDGMLLPGEHLHDAELCAWLGLSRTPVRDALGRLEEDGLVQVTRGAPELAAAVTKVETDIPGLEVKLEPVTAGRIYKVGVTLTPEMAKGDFAGIIRIHTASAKAPLLEIPTRGTLE